MNHIILLISIIALLLTGCSGETVQRSAYNYIKISNCNLENTLIPQECYRSYDQEYDADQKAVREYQESVNDE